jgi:LCP family protein required for cell wall assembly
MVDSANKHARRSVWKRIGGFLFFVVIPLLLIVLSIWFGRGAGGDILSQFAIRQEYYANHSGYEAEATAIAPETGRNPGEIRLVGGWQADGQDATPTPSPLIFATNTPSLEVEVTIPAVNTVAPDATPTIPQVDPLVLPTVLLPQDAPDDVVAATAVPNALEPITRDYDLVNILLLGSDEEITDDNTIRTDTMIIVSINRDTGTVSMMSLPRDMYVYIPALGMNRLNVAYGWGQNVGWEPGGGFGLFRQVILYNFGINVHYYAKVNISEFEQLVDLVGGVDLAVDCAIQDYFPVAPIEELDLTRPIEENYELRTLDVGYYTLDGFEAQWYARSRRNSSDFDRGRRQQQVIRAIFRKALDSGQLASLPALWNEGMEIVETNMTLNEALSLLPIALNINSREIESFTFIPTYHTDSWTTPDAENVQLPVYETLIPFLEDFYTPPSTNTIEIRGSTVRVFNATGIDNMDRVAAERLQFDGFAAIAAGTSDEVQAETILIDRTGQTKGNSRFKMVDVLGVTRGNILEEPDPNRAADFDVILGENYDSCTFGVLDVD